MEEIKDTKIYTCVMCKSIATKVAPDTNEPLCEYHYNINDSIIKGKK